MKYILLVLLFIAAYYVIVRPLVKALIGPAEQEKLRDQDVGYTEYEEVLEEEERR